MTKSELIDQIRVINRGATREFLAEFTERELSDYVRQLGGLDSQRLEFEASLATSRLESPAAVV